MPRRDPYLRSFRRVVRDASAAFISKPLDPEKLVRQIRRFVRVDDGPWTGSTASSNAAAPADWPAVDGIDSIAASRCLGGDARLFRVMLARMLDEFADLGISPPAGVSDLGPLASRLHRLAGPAAALGAFALKNSCADAEAACREGRVVRATELTGLVVDRLARLRVAAAGMIDSTTAPIVSSATPAPLKSGDLTELLRLLRELNLEAPARFVAMAPQLRRSLGESGYASMQVQVDNLQFAEAATSLAGLDL